MLDLNTIFKNHFENRQISDNKLRKFAEVHLERLKANNSGGVFTTVITDTTSALNSYHSAITDEDIKFAAQQGLTIKVKKLLNDFKKFTVKSEGLVRSTFGKKSDGYQEFFPYNKEEYWQCSLKNAEMLMTRLIASADKYSAQLGTDLKNNAQTLLTEFKNAREAQLLKKGEVADSKTKSKKARQELEIQLMKNLYFIGYTYPGNVNRCNDFFDQSFLRKKEKD